MKPKQDDHKHHYQVIARRMVTTVILVSLTPMLLVAGVVYQRFHVAYQEKVREHIGELMEKHKLHIDNYLQEKLNNIRIIAESFPVEQLKDEAFLIKKLDLLQKKYGYVFEDLGFINDAGIQIAYAGPFRLEKARYTDADWFRKAMKSDEFISDVFLGLRGLPHFIVAVRLVAGQENWILRSTISFMAFNNLVENLRIDKTGFAFILNRSGQFQTKPHFDVLPKEKYLDAFLKEDPSEKDSIRIIRKKDEKGHERIYAGALMKKGDWLMIYQQDVDDAFFDLRQAQAITFSLILLGGLCIVYMAMVQSRDMLRRIVRADREKEMMNRQVVETGKLASIGQLAAGIAHEINNPVAIMVEEAGWMMDLLPEEDFREAKNREEFERALTQIRTQGQRCKEITHKLLSFARKADATTQEVQLNDMITELVELTGQRAKYGNINIRTFLDEKIPLLHISLTQIQQVFMNLINNAVDAMEHTGGALDIRTRLVGETVIIDVVDTGPGIPPANLKRIFDPFFTTKPVGKGTGLGLSICYGIIEKIGGTIEVESTLNKGTAFHIEVPVIEVDEKG